MEERQATMSVCYLCEGMQLSDGSPIGLLESAWAASDSPHAEKILIAWHSFSLDEARATYTCCPACLDHLMSKTQCPVCMQRQEFKGDVSAASQALA